MINRNNKKGFTIVELVIVIAVIAILAAVLIPTFSGIIAKANESADIKAVREMNTALAAEFAVEKPAADNMEAVINALEKNGFNSLESLAPISKGYKFVWSYVDCCIILLNAENEIVFPAAENLEFDPTISEIKDLNDGAKYVDIVTNDVKSLKSAFAVGAETVKLSDDVKIEAKDILSVPEGAEMEVDLNGKSITAGMVDSSKHANVLHVYGKVTLKNGTIETRNVMVYDGGELIIEEGVTIKALDTDGGACLWVYEGGKVTLNGGTFVSESYTYAIMNRGGEITINEGVSVTAARGGISNNSGTTVINGGAFTVTGEHNDAAHVVYVFDGTVTVNGGTFTNNGSGEDLCKDSSGSGSIIDNRSK